MMITLPCPHIQIHQILVIGQACVSLSKLVENLLPSKNLVTHWHMKRVSFSLKLISLRLLFWDWFMHIFVFFKISHHITLYYLLWLWWVFDCLAGCPYRRREQMMVWDRYWMWTQLYVQIVVITGVHVRTSSDILLDLSSLAYEVCYNYILHS